MTKTTHIGDKIRQLRKAVVPDMNQSDLARGLGVTATTIQKWEALDAQPRPDKLPLLAALLGVDVQTLVKNTSYELLISDTATAKAPLDRTLEAGPTMRGALPVISWKQAKEWAAVKTKTEVSEWVPFPFPHGDKSFAMKVVGESMYDPGSDLSFAPGEFVAVDPGVVPVNRCIVVVATHGEENASLKQLLIDPDGTKMLRSLNPEWPRRTAEMVNAEVVGVVIGKWVSFLRG